MSSTPFQTDASRPSALPSANIGARNYEQPPTETSEEYLDQVEEEWNKKVDAEVDTLVDGMVDLVAIASVRPLVHWLYYNGATIYPESGG